MTLLNLIALSLVIISPSFVVVPERALAFEIKPKPRNNSDSKYPCPKQQLCGNVTIQYPFGIGADCSLNPSFSIVCDTTLNPPRALVEALNYLELLNMSARESKFEVKIPVISNCSQEVGRAKANQLGLELQNVPFALSASDNVYTAMGCDNLALLMKEGQVIGGCMSYCHESGLNRSRELSDCHGLDCCQTTTPGPLKALNVMFRSTVSGHDKDNERDKKCSHAMIAKKSWLESSSEANISAIDLFGVQFVPAVLDWVIITSEDYGTCTSLGTNYNNDSGINSNTNICGANAYCSNSTSSSEGYACFCRQGYTGNPYSECTDIDECANENNPCGQIMICTNIPGGFNCSCRYGYSGDSCNPIPFEYMWVLTMTAQGGGLMLLLALLWWIDRVYTKRKKIWLKKKYFMRNGGPLLQEKLSSEDTVKKIDLFNAKELKRATDNYNKNRILGQGGQGIIYLGMLTDKRIVAAKVYTQFEPDNVEQFINEVVILSMINHRHVVKILGCCLEIEFPVLVYEFIPNGTLFSYIQDRDESLFPFSWDMRLQIAAEIAQALCYLHSEASTAIYHRDIKSKNILLDARFRAKVADFGIAMSISIDETHKSTMVRGTFGYVDPEYFKNKKFTDKSDVYSFGVVLVELLTGLEPIISRSADEKDKTGLVSHFESSMEKRRLLSIVDTRIVKVAKKGEIIATANLARMCLNAKGKKRPTMKEVVMELAWIRGTRSEASLLGKLAAKGSTSKLPNLYSPNQMRQYRQNLPL